jgi:RimJ/RimL family protein N-acetyltransferase
MHIRRLVEADAESYRRLRLRALRESPEAFGSSYEETVQEPLTAMARRISPNATAPDNFALGAFDPGLIGMVGFSRESRLKTRHKGAVWGMYVVREAQGRGVGRALLQTVIAEAQRIEGLEQIGLYVVSSNQAACHLYRSCGFELYGVERSALKIGEQYHDEDLMVLSLL